MDILNTLWGRTIPGLIPTPTPTRAILAPPKLTKKPSSTNLEQKTPTASPPVELDIKSLEYFRNRDLSRTAFSYDILIDAGWWPDKILLFLEILRVAYTNFITPYTNNGTIYDEPIRTATWYFHDPKYRDEPAVKQYRQIGNYEIPKDYLNKVISEDNCYMYEIESRPRSSNEQKHYYLVTALTRMLDAGQIVVKDKPLPREDEYAVRIFCSVIRLKQAYNIVDDTLRNILSGAINGVKLAMDLPSYFSNLIREIDETVMCKIKKVMDEQFFNYANIFRDLLLYALHEVIMFSHVMGCKQIIDDAKAPIVRLTPYAEYKFFTGDTIERIEYIYKIFVSQLIERNVRSKYAVTSLTTSNYETYQKMMKEVDDSVAALALVPPKYFKRHFHVEDEDFRAFTVTTFVDTPSHINQEAKDSKEIKDETTSTVDSTVSTVVDGLVSPRKRAHSRRITYNGPMLLGHARIGAVPLLSASHQPTSSTTTVTVQSPRS